MKPTCTSGTEDALIPLIRLIIFLLGLLLRHNLRLFL